MQRDHSYETRSSSSAHYTRPSNKGTSPREQHSLRNPVKQQRFCIILRRETVTSGILQRKRGLTDQYELVVYAMPQLAGRLCVNASAHAVKLCHADLFERTEVEAHVLRGPRERAITCRCRVT
jgi:hypothetical protein